MRVLHIKNWILGRLAFGKIEIEVEVAVMLAEEEKKAHHVRTDLIDQLVKGDVGRLARRHLELLAAACERHELIDDRVDSRGIMAERAHRREHLLMLRN